MESSRFVLGALVWLGLTQPACGVDSDVPDIGYCESVADWGDQASSLEEQILVIVNERRSEGADCGSKGSFGPTGELTMNSNLRCAARKHSAHMAAEDYFSHTAPDGTGPGERIDSAEYDSGAWGENIAAGNAAAADTMDQWMNSDGHCANIMSPSFTEIGVGYAEGGEYSHVWTQVFGAPAGG